MAAPHSRESRRLYHQKNFGLAGLVMFGRYHYLSSRSRLLPHSHRDAVEICFLERGEQTYGVDKLVYRLSGNDQFLTFPGEIHDTADLPEQPGILYWLILKLNHTKNFLGLAPKPAARMARELSKMPNRHFRAHPDCGRILGELVVLLSKEETATQTSSFRALRRQFLVLQYLTLTIQASREGRKASTTPVIQRVLTYLDAHLNDPVSVARLAEVAQLSESRFKARFKREIGIPPAEFWMRKKVEKAAILLKKQNVTQVAYELGFSSSQYFATVFKRYTLTSPSKFLATKGR